MKKKAHCQARQYLNFFIFLLDFILIYSYICTIRPGNSAGIIHSCASPNYYFALSIVITWGLTLNEILLIFQVALFCMSFPHLIDLTFSILFSILLVALFLLSALSYQLSIQRPATSNQSTSVQRPVTPLLTLRFFNCMIVLCFSNNDA